MPLWTRSDNSFKFNFVSENDLASTLEIALLDSNPPLAEPTRSGFIFNFQIPDVTTEHMETETDPSAVIEAPKHSQEQAPPFMQESCPSFESLVQSKAKKNKKSGKKKTTESSESQGKTSLSEGSLADKDTVLTTEQLLQRELDWCIEQLQLGINTQKGTPKQKKDASCALKTLRSSKAPLAKKRQVMRAMAGDYRKKMEEEKEKQIKIIQNAMTSLQVKSISGSSKKSVFYRKAENKTQVPNTDVESTTN